MTIERRVRMSATAAIAVAALLGAGVSMAASPDAPEIGAAELVVSSVRGRLGQITRELAIKDDVFSEEVIETEDDAAARIVFLDGSELSMGPSSRMVLDRYVYDPNSGVGEMVMQMVTGVFEFASGEIPSENYDLGTPFGNLAIRGTRCILDLVAGLRLVLRCSELEEVSIAGQTITQDSNCLLVPLPGTGNPTLLDGDECDQEMSRAYAMLNLLGRLDLEPAAGMIREVEIPGADDDDPLGPGGPGINALSGGPGISPQ